MSGAAFEQMSVGQAIAGGTTYSADEAWEAAARAAHGNQAALAAMVAKGRSSSMSAGRVDVGGAGFGATLNYANDLGKLNPKAANYEQQKADLTAKFHEKVLEGQGPGVLGHSSMKPQAIKALIEPLRDRVLSARAQAVQTGTAEDRAKYDRELGILAGVYDSVAASSPQNARILADGFPDDPDTGKAGQAGVLGFALGRDQNGRPVTIRDEIETARNSNSAAFLEVRREINAQTREGNTVGGVGTGTGGIPGPPTVPTL